jgi:hypothetical protein
MRASISPATKGATALETSMLKVVVTFSGAGLLASLLFLTYGLDLSPGRF